MNDTTSPLDTDTRDALQNAVLTRFKLLAAQQPGPLDARAALRMAAEACRDELATRWANTQKADAVRGKQAPCRRVHYLSMEFLMGRALGNALAALGIEPLLRSIMAEHGIEWTDVLEGESDAALGNGVSRGEFARRVTGSSDVFHHGGRQPVASVNFVAAHDGFTLHDAVSYTQKRNQANGEDNRDGHAHEISANFGAEGDSSDAAIGETRIRVRRALLATVMVAQGTPMLCAGDEFGNSQNGNNNAYCQDNPTGWLDWSAGDRDPGTALLVSKLAALRRINPLLRHPRWFADEGDTGSTPQLHWYTAAGERMAIADWHDRSDSVFACQVQDGAQAVPDSCVVFNPQDSERSVRLAHGPWRIVLDTTAPEAPASHEPIYHVTVPAHSLLILARAQTTQELHP